MKTKEELLPDIENYVNEQVSPMIEFEVKHCAKSWSSANREATIEIIAKEILEKFDAFDVLDINDVLKMLHKVVQDTTRAQINHQAIEILINTD